MDFREEMDGSDDTSFVKQKSFDAENIQKLRRQVASYKPRLCGGEHEWRIGEIQTPYQPFADENERHTVAAQCVCPDREANPVCAHITYDYKPDPFGDQIRELISLGILDADEWIHRSAEVNRQIYIFDEKVGAYRWNEHRDLEMPTATRKELQRPVFTAVKNLQRELLNIIDAALQS